MIELRGKYNTAKVFTNNIEQEAISQIIDLCNQEFCKDSRVRIMPDVHAGADCTIGTTMTIKDKAVPYLVGGDIGCGMEVLKLSDKDVDFAKLDEVIRNYISSGFEIRDEEHEYCSKIRFNDLICKNQVNLTKAKLSVGTLGGGNHFIELNSDEDGFLYLVIHSGSRNLGNQVAKYYQDTAYKTLKSLSSKDLKDTLINKLKSEHREKDIQTELKKLVLPKIRKGFSYLTGEHFNSYLNDMQIVQEFAVYNRKAIADIIVKHMGFSVIEQFTTTHNYIDLDNMILRKGSISAQKGEKVIIPLNMRDGSIIAIGKGNEDWNYSAPHGAGRVYSRSKAKENITFKEFEESMKDVWTTSVSVSTIDESPMAYKPMNDITDNINDTVEIINIIKPLYNFKAS